MTFLAIIVMVFIFAGMIKGMIGLGLPAVSMGLLTIAMSPFQAASLLIVPSMITNIWQLFAEGRVWTFVRRFWSLLFGIVIGSVWSFLPTLSQSHGKTSEILLGSMLVLYGLYGLCVKKLPHLAAHERWLSPLVGYIGGAVTVATGVVIIPVVPYLQSLHLNRDELVQALGLTFTVSTICLAVFLHHNPMQGITLDYRLSAVALVAALVGMWLGKKIRYQLNEQRFRRLFFMGLVALGGYMLSH
ncbi:MULTISPECIES: sulfite exporter TauE/SafE family protein [Acinetobacter]|uniref:sulfite exporter TauE/SafE family protein n=1 Tax=Acinetobacter TaxID=469 RepID=UPI00124C5036|nr:MULTISPECIES: sulfite exporter TauE/SafE family protein [Acinetobacter]MCH7384237.1 sulfite exporter TauE/SafE family protein [Acinetobacter dispersus]MCU4337246.1 sulfite exporter TauE/SafE family protein [Acinetobacter dispersus]